ncbi:MAG: N-acetylmuramoyl-L-alanine amidase [Lachnospiraceae bacterium]|nr:N-acetylmuramoyl-L-alanine amidase [Lachnospiraceae bacterium]
MNQRHKKTRNNKLGRRRKLLCFLGLTVIVMIVIIACSSGDDDDIRKYNRVGNYTEPDENPPTAGAEDIVTTEPSQPVGTATPTPAPKRYTIVLDPGHGGKDPGASFDGRVEAKLNLELALRLKAYLTDKYDNVTVILTREDDTELVKNDKGADLRARVETGVTNHADIVVSLHLDASDNHKQNGAMVIISKQNNITEQSKLLANCILNQLSNIGLNNRGPFKRDSQDTFDDNGVPVDYYAICRHGASNNLISVIVESCFIDNDYDAQFINSAEALDRLAEAEGKGIMEFLTKHYTGGSKN